MIVCKKCGFENGDNAKHCGGCGDLLSTQAVANTTFKNICPKCGAVNDVKGAAFCQNCGAQIAENKKSEDHLYYIFTLDFHSETDIAMLTKTNGEFFLYKDRAEFIVRNTVFGFIKDKGEAGKVYTYPIKDIDSCYFEGAQNFILQMKDGKKAKFSTIRTQIVAEVVPMINELLDRQNGLVLESKLDPDSYSFVMQLHNCVEINDRATAVIGAVQKGSVCEKTPVSIIAEDGTLKGTFTVHGVAVNKTACESAGEGDTDVALLLYCPVDYVQFGDCVCIAKEE